MALKVVSYDPEKGTALVSLNGVERELKATFSLDRMVVSGLAVRYRTGKRVWAASFTYWFASGNINNIHPPMDHHARRATVSVVGFIDDFRKVETPLSAEEEITRLVKQNRAWSAVRAAWANAEDNPDANKKKQFTLFQEITSQGEVLPLNAFTCESCGESYVYRSLSEKPNGAGVTPKDFVPAYCPDCGADLSEAVPFDPTEIQMALHAVYPYKTAKWSTEVKKNKPHTGAADCDSCVHQRERAAKKAGRK